MSNLQKFNDTIKEFDNEVGKLKAVSEAYQKLQGLTLAYDGISKQFEENSKTLDKINELQKLQQEKVSKSLTELDNANRQNKSELAKLIEVKTEQIRRDNKEFYRELDNFNKQSKSELVKLVEEKTDQIRKENKDFYKDLESTIKIKLDENKSQIKQLIESERTQIKQIFEIEFAKNTKELRQVIETETDKQTQLLLENQNTIKVSLWVIGGLTLILSILTVIKLWT